MGEAPLVLFFYGIYMQYTICVKLKKICLILKALTVEEIETRISHWN